MSRPGSNRPPSGNENDFSTQDGEISSADRRAEITLICQHEKREFIFESVSVKFKREVKKR